jgi:hypothetical protein
MFRLQFIKQVPKKNLATYEHIRYDLRMHKQNSPTCIHLQLVQDSRLSSDERIPEAEVLNSGTIISLDITCALRGRGRCPLQHG